jgi:uncharacterized protein YqgC (DUF456 family)
MEIAILTIGIILIIIGIVSCVMPPLPGPPITFIALLLIHFFYPGAEVKQWLLITLGVLSFAITYLDNLVAVWGTKKFGGTKAGVRGSFIGLIAGLFLLTPILGPLSVFLGPLLGALIGELISGQKIEQALKSALGSFIGFLLGIGLKLIVSIFIGIEFFMHIF